MQCLKTRFVCKVGIRAFCERSLVFSPAALTLGKTQQSAKGERAFSSFRGLLLTGYLRFADFPFYVFCRWSLNMKNSIARLCGVICLAEVDENMMD